VKYHSWCQVLAANVYYVILTFGHGPCKLLNASNAWANTASKLKKDPKNNNTEALVQTLTCGTSNITTNIIFHDYRTNFLFASIWSNHYKISILSPPVPEIAFTWCKLAHVSQAPGMRTQTFYSSCIMEGATHFKDQPVELSITCMKHLHTHPWDLTRTGQLVLCKCNLRDA
jgi:hypothetical protein